MPVREAPRPPFPLVKRRPTRSFLSNATPTRIKRSKPCSVSSLRRPSFSNTNYRSPIINHQIRSRVPPPLMAAAGMAGAFTIDFGRVLLERWIASSAQTAFDVACGSSTFWPTHSGLGQCRRFYFPHSMLSVFHPFTAGIRNWQFCRQRGRRFAQWRFK